MVVGGSRPASAPGRRSQNTPCRRSRGKTAWCFLRWATESYHKKLKIESTKKKPRRRTGLISLVGEVLFGDVVLVGRYIECPAILFKSVVAIGGNECANLLLVSIAKNQFGASTKAADRP